MRENPGWAVRYRVSHGLQTGKLAEIHHVDVGAQPDVIGEIPANVIRVFIDYDLIGVPVPIIAITDVVGSHTKIETAKPEPIRTTSREAPFVALAEATGKVAVLPRMIEMVVWIIGAGVVSNPDVAPCVNVRRIWVARLIGEVARRWFASSRLSRSRAFLRGVCGSDLMGRTASWSRPMSWYMSATNLRMALATRGFGVAAILRKSGKRQKEQGRNRKSCCLHVTSSKGPYPCGSGVRPGSWPALTL